MGLLSCRQSLAEELLHQASLIAEELSRNRHDPLLPPRIGGTGHVSREEVLPHQDFMACFAIERFSWVLQLPFFVRCIPGSETNHSFAFPEEDSTFVEDFTGYSLEHLRIEVVVLERYFAFDIPQTGLPKMVVAFKE